MVKLNKIYTKTGDKGETGLTDGSRVSKDDLRIRAYGAVDELNSFIGLCHVKAAHDADMQHVLKYILNDLFDLGADLSTPIDGDKNEEYALRMVPSQIEQLENWIDQYNEKLDPLKSFTLPTGTELSAQLHIARATARRAEREIVALIDRDDDAVNSLAVQYVNRLSDLLFVLTRYENKLHGEGDILWVPAKNRAD